MSQYNYEQTQSYFTNENFLLKTNQSVFIPQLQNDKIYSSNDELFHQCSNDFSFLRKRSSNNYVNYVDEDYDKENIPYNFEFSAKRTHNFYRQKKPLKEINVNDISNTNLLKKEDYFANIVLMSIKEKKQIDKEERQKKKYNKIHMIKLQQKYSQNSKNDMIDY